MTPAGRLARLATVAAMALPALSGCAVVLPLAAAGALGKATIDVVRGEGPRSDSEERVASRSAPVPSAEIAEAGAGNVQDSTGITRLDMTELPAPGRPPLAAPIEAAALPVSRDTAGGSRGPWALMAGYVARQRDARSAGRSVRTAVLVPGVRLSAPTFVDCGPKPLSVVVDLDAEATKPNLPLDPQTVAPATAEAAFGLHSEGVTILWLSDRPLAQANDVRLALTRAGLWGEGDRLLLADGTRKQERRWAAARDRCIVAQLGDSRADMDELYEYLRKPEAAHMLNGLWNAGWFLAPTPIATKE